jgi:phosphopantetheine--protein transferase-like protein
MRVVGVGVDIERIQGVVASQALHMPGVFFTERECALANSPSAQERGAVLTLMFAAKEALFKALPWQSGMYWTDMEVVQALDGAAQFMFHGVLRERVESQGLRVCLSCRALGPSVMAHVLILSA